jgi:hypothetical protein
MIDKTIQIEGIDVNTYAGKALKAVKTKARGIMGDDLLTFKLMDFVSFFLLNNKFCNKGFFITEENREECYIKIIENGDEQLISDLENYLRILDELKIVERNRKEYFEIVTSIQSLEDYNDREKINSIIEEYLRR